jgi:hypothetical protein
MSTGYPSNRISMRSGSACKLISLPCPNVADRQFTRCGPFSIRSSTCCAPAAHGAISPPTFHRGRPSSPISGVCASKGPGRSCYGRCTALDANDKEGILTQVPPAWIRHPRENGRGVVWDLWLRCPQTHQRAETAHPRGYAGHPHLYLRDPCRYTRYQRSSLFARRAHILRAASLQRFGQMRQARGQEAG